MQKNIVRRLALAIMLFTVLLQANAEKVSHPHGGPAGSWRLLGTTQANHAADHDAIYIKGPYDFFRRLKFKVTNAPLNIQHMVVRYDDGVGPENIEVRYKVPKGGESRIIDLKGGKRKLKSVEFWYDTKGFLNGKADVTLFGMK
jgi:hypothetical protein